MKTSKHILLTLCVTDRGPWLFKELCDEKDAEIYRPPSLLALLIQKNICFVSGAAAHS